MSDDASRMVVRHATEQAGRAPARVSDTPAPGVRERGGSTGSGAFPAPFVHPTAIIEGGALLGPGTRVWALTQIRAGARTGEQCNIGMGVFIDVDVQIGHRCKIQNHALIFLGSRVADEVFIGPGACLTNDRHPRAATAQGALKGLDDWRVSGVTLEQGSSVGAHAVVIGGTHVGKFAMIGAGAVVTRDVHPHALVVGTPARRIGWVCRCGPRLDADLRCPECGRCHLPAGEAIQERP